MCSKWIFFFFPPWPKCITQNDNREWNVFARCLGELPFPCSLGFPEKFALNSSCFSLLPCSFLGDGEEGNRGLARNMKLMAFPVWEGNIKRGRRALFLGQGVSSGSCLVQKFCYMGKVLLLFPRHSCLGADCCHLTCRDCAFHLLRAKARIQHRHHGTLTFNRTHHPKLSGHPRKGANIKQMWGHNVCILLG